MPCRIQVQRGGSGKSQRSEEDAEVGELLLGRDLVFFVEESY